MEKLIWSMTFQPFHVRYWQLDEHYNDLLTFYWQVYAFVASVSSWINCIKFFNVYVVSQRGTESSANTTITTTITGVNLSTSIWGVPSLILFVVRFALCLVRSSPFRNLKPRHLLLMPLHPYKTYISYVRTPAKSASNPSTGTDRFVTSCHVHLQQKKPVNWRAYVETCQ